MGEIIGLDPGWDGGPYSRVSETAGVLEVRSEYSGERYQFMIDGGKVHQRWMEEDEDGVVCPSEWHRLTDDEVLELMCDYLDGPVSKWVDEHTHDIEWDACETCTVRERCEHLKGRKPT